MKTNKQAQYKSDELSIIKQVFIFIQLILQLVIRSLIFLLFITLFKAVTFQSPAKNFLLTVFPFSLHFLILFCFQAFSEGFSKIIRQDWFYSIGRVLFYDLSEKNFRVGFLNFLLIQLENLVVYILMLSFGLKNVYFFLIFDASFYAEAYQVLIVVIASSFFLLGLNLVWVFFLCPFSSKRRTYFVNMVKSLQSFFSIPRIFFIEFLPKFPTFMNIPNIQANQRQ